MHRILILLATLQGCALDAYEPAPEGAEAPKTTDDNSVGPGSQEPPTGPACRPVLDKQFNVVEWQCAGYAAPPPDPENDGRLVDFELTGPVESGPESPAK